MEYGIFYNLLATQNNNYNRTKYIYSHKKIPPLDFEDHYIQTTASSLIQ